METDGNIKEIKKDAFWMISVSACIYIPHWARKHLALRQPERNRWRKSLPFSDFNFFVTKEINNLFLLRKELREILFGFFPLHITLFGVVGFSPTQQHSRQYKFREKRAECWARKKLKASNIIFDLGLNKFINTTQLVCADKNVSSLSRYTKRQNLSQDLMSGNWDAAHEEMHFELPFFRTSAIAIG